MKKPVFCGSATAVVTPFSGGAVDYFALERLLLRQIDSGADALVVCGTTGEASTLSSEEQAEVIRFAGSVVGGKIPLIAGTGSNDTATACKRTKNATDAGADGVLVVTPYYNKSTQKGLIYHYEAVAASTDLPVILYNVPTRTCVDVSADTYERLSTVENIVAVKEASPDIVKIGEIIRRCGDGLAVYSGNDDMALPVIFLGGKGVISVAGNLIPSEMYALCRAALSGDYRLAVELHMKYLPLMRGLFCTVNPIAVKTALSMMGLCGGEFRLPMCEPEDDVLEKIRNLLIRYSLIQPAKG